ncbi:MAG: iron ABC transporter permease [Deltaproteobacteria bacterium]|nr:iron ABC transporter permease [Deltaproteobacteria bacterium]
MSFLSATGTRLTGKRLIAIVALSLVACAVIGLVAPLFGVVSGVGGRSIEFLTSYDSPIVAVRLPRVLASLLVGAALSASGCALQGWLRNPLADPFTLGISSGSSLAAVLAIRIGLERLLGGWGIGVAALAGAVGTLLLVERLARVGKHLPPATVVLAGVTISMFCSAASVLIQYTSDFTDVSHMLAWMMGSLDSVRLVGVEITAVPVVIALIILCAFARELNALAAGPDVAASLGVAVGRAQVIVFAIASVLVGAAIALGGPIGFIGLIVPHTLRALIGPDHRALLPASIFGGAILLVLCDTLARTVIAPAHLPTGAVTAVMGGPFFVAILVRQKQRAALWGRA